MNYLDNTLPSAVPSVRSVHSVADNMDQGTRQLSSAHSGTQPGNAAVPPASSTTVSEIKSEFASIPHLESPLSIAQKYERWLDAFIDAQPFPTPDAPASPQSLRAIERGLRSLACATSIRKTLFQLSTAAETARQAAERAALARAQAAEAAAQASAQAAAAAKNDLFDPILFDRAIAGRPDRLALAAQLLAEQEGREFRAYRFYLEHRICYPVEAFTPGVESPLAGFEPLSREDAIARYPRVFSEKFFAYYDSKDAFNLLMDKRARDVKKNPERDRYYRDPDPNYPDDPNDPPIKPFNASNPTNTPPKYRAQADPQFALTSNLMPLEPTSTEPPHDSSSPTPAEPHSPATAEPHSPAVDELLSPLATEPRSPAATDPLSMATESLSPMGALSKLDFNVGGRVPAGELPIANPTAASNNDQPIQSIMSIGSIQSVRAVPAVPTLATVPTVSCTVSTPSTPSTPSTSPTPSTEIHHQESIAEPSKISSISSPRVSKGQDSAPPPLPPMYWRDPPKPRRLRRNSPTDDPP